MKIKEEQEDEAKNSEEKDQLWTRVIIDSLVKKKSTHPIPMKRHIHINSSYKNIATQCHARWQRRSVQLMLMTGGSSWVSSTFQITPKRKKGERKKETKSRHTPSRFTILTD